MRDATTRADEDNARTLVYQRSLEEGATLLASGAIPAASGVVSLGGAATVMANSEAPPPLLASSSAGVGRTTVLPRLSTASASPGSEPVWTLDSAPRYEERRPLGAGGLGEVALVFDHDIGRHVALKRMRAEVAGPDSLLRFAQEVRIVGRLEHPNIVPIHDVGVDERQQRYFVMKYVDGETLETVIEKLAAGDREYERRYPIDRRADICLDILQAISYAHSQGIIHRDIKPANVMIGRYGEVMVMDWGIAKQIGQGDVVSSAPVAAPDAAQSPPARARLIETVQNALVGTPAYMSPEQARGENHAIDERSDVYSLAVLIHELFTLRHYLADIAGVEETLAAVADPARPAFQISLAGGPKMPPEYAQFLVKGMQKDPAKRFRSVAEMAQEFQRIRAGYFEVCCPFTMVKRPTYGVLHLIDRHPALMASGMIAAGAVFLTTLAYTLWHLTG